MFCKNCGAQLPENAQFCASCGTKASADLSTAPAGEEIPAQAAEPVDYTQEAPAQYQQAPEQFATEPNPYEQQSQVYSNFAQADFDINQTQPKKKRKGLVAILVSVVAIILAGVLLFFTVVKPNLSPIGKLKKAEMANLTSLSNDVSEAYGAFISNNTADGSAELQMKLSVGTEILQMLESLLAEEDIDLPLDWLNDVRLSAFVNMNGNASRVKYALGLDEQNIVDVDLIADMEKEEFYIGIPTLSDKYLNIPIDELSALSASGSEYYDEDYDYYEEDYYTDYYDDYSDSSSSYSVMSTILTDHEFLNSLPSEDALNDLLDKCIEIIFDNFENVTKSTETLKVDSISQTVTALKVDISTITLLDIAEDILKEAQSDKQIKEIIDNVSTYLESKDMLDGEEDPYDAFSEAVAEGLESLSEERETADNKTIATYTCYTDSKNNVVGRGLDIDNQSALYHATVKSGDDFATIINFNDALKYEGSGTVKNGVKNAAYTLSIDSGYSFGLSYDIFDVELADFSTKDGKLNGSIRLTPSEFLLDQMGIDNSAIPAISILKPSIELKFDNTDENGNMEINVLNGESVLFGFSASTLSSTTSEPVNFPSEDNIIAFENAQEWVESFDIEKLKDALNNSSLPKGLLDTLLSEIDSLGAETAVDSIR